MAEIAKADSRKKAQARKVAAPIQPAPAFRHYIARPVNGRIAGRITYAFFDEACQAATEKAGIMLRPIQVVAVHAGDAGNLYRVVRTFPGGRAQ